MTYSSIITLSALCNCVNYEIEDIIMNSFMAPVILVFLYIRTNVHATKTLKFHARIHFKEVNSKYDLCSRQLLNYTYPANALYLLLYRERSPLSNRKIVNDVAKIS